jgi:hypothetical protein
MKEYCVLLRYTETSCKKLVIAANGYSSEDGLIQFYRYSKTGSKNIVMTTPSVRVVYILLADEKNKIDNED